MVKSLKISLVFMLMSSGVVLAQGLCKYSGNSINPSITATAVLQKDGNYKYTYTVVNQSSSKYPIMWFFVETNKLHANVSVPTDWKVIPPTTEHDVRLRWASKSYQVGEIQVGNSLNGFEFISSNGPGSIKYISQGESFPGMQNKISSKDVIGLCPGSYQGGSSIPGQESIEGITIGPIPSAQKSAHLLIKRINSKSGWTGDVRATDKELLSFSPLEKGKIEVALLSDENLNPEDIDIPTILFGRGDAKPLTASITDCDISSSKRVKALVMTFNLEDVNVLCNADHALFLTGKMKNGNTIFGGVKIRVTECTQENWVREANRMLEAGELELPTGKYKNK